MDLGSRYFDPLANISHREVAYNIKIPSYNVARRRIFKLGLAQVQSGVFLYLYLFEYVVEVTNYGLYI